MAPFVFGALPVPTACESQRFHDATPISLIPRRDQAQHVASLVDPGFLNPSEISRRQRPKNAITLCWSSPTMAA